MKKYMYECIETGEKILANSGDEFGREYERRHGKGSTCSGAIRLVNLETGEENMMYPFVIKG